MSNSAGTEKCTEKPIKLSAKHYDTSLNKNIEHIFPKTLKLSWLKGKGNINKIYKARTKRDLAKKIFHMFMANLLDHLIETGDIFILPIPGHNYIQIEEMPDAEVRHRMQIGTYQFVDIIQSDFKIYYFVLRFASSSRTSTRVIRIDYNRYKYLCDKVNKGKRYCSKYVYRT